MPFGFVPLKTARLTFPLGVGAGAGQESVPSLPNSSAGRRRSQAGCYRAALCRPGRRA